MSQSQQTCDHVTLPGKRDFVDVIRDSPGPCKRIKVRERRCKDGSISQRRKNKRTNKQNNATLLSLKIIVRDCDPKNEGSLRNLEKGSSPRAFRAKAGLLPA